MLAPFRSINHQRFSGLRKVFLKSFKIVFQVFQVFHSGLDSRLGEFYSAAPKKLYETCWPENVHIVTNILRIENEC